MSAEPIVVPAAQPEQPAAKWHHAAAWVLGLIAASVACAQVVFYFVRTVDDLFISLRYAEHLAAGQGLTYNSGERVEGFSSPLWVVLQSVGIRSGLEGVTVTKLLSLASVGALLVCVGWYARTVPKAVLPVAPMAVAALAANSYVLSWGLLGLETPLYLALLVAWPLALHRLLLWPSPGARAFAILAGVALGCVRPEAPLYVATLLVAVAASRVGEDPARERLLRLAPVAGAVAAVLALLLLARQAYFGAFLPHTYFAKAGQGFELSRLLPLVAEGAHPSEVIVVAAALAAAIWLAARRVDLVPLACLLTNALFVCSVASDWMPNQRHLLPIWVFSCLSLAAALDALIRSRWWWQIGAAAGALLLLWCATHQFSTDSRFSKKEFRSHGRGRIWVRKKAPQAWEDSVLALRRMSPPHAARMQVSSMGMIQQLFRILEASSAPEADSWYVGRDIGRVGYYSPVRIFDTDGLFTPEVVNDPQWLASARVSRALARQALARKPILAEVVEGWSRGIGQLGGELGDYDVLLGLRRRPHVLRRRVARPSPDETLQRYERVAERFPAAFFVATLYGECVGAAFERRYAHVRRVLQGRTNFEVDELPDELPAMEVSFERGSITLHGCTFLSNVVAPGEMATLRCYFEPTRRLERDFLIFVHLTDPAGRRLLSADHEPCGGFCSTRDWAVGRIIEDRVDIVIPEDLPVPSLTPHLGLFQGHYRARVRPVEKTDGDNRVIGPTLRIRRSVEKE